MDLSLLAFEPVFLEGGVIWGSCSFYKHVPFDRYPAEFQEVSSSPLVSEYPLVIALPVELSPVFGAAPPPRFLGVAELDVSDAPLEHPAVYRTEYFFGYADTEVVRPSA